MSFSMPDFAAQVCGRKPTDLSDLGIKRALRLEAESQPNDKAVILPIFGYYEHQYTASEGLVIDCYLEHTKAEQQSHDSHGEPESIELIYALVNGVDIFDVLSDEVMDLIEEEALQSMTMDKWNSDYDKGEARALEMAES